MPIRLSRQWMVAGAGAVAAVVAMTLLFRQAPPSRAVAVHAAAPAGAVVDAVRAPWYGLRLLLDPVTFQNAPGTAGTEPKINAAAGVLVDVDTHQVLWQSNDHKRLPPASTIKLLTAMVVLENESASKLITVTPDAVAQVAGDESKMYLKPGQRLTVAELLSGLLIVSANDAADVLASDTVGLEKFVGSMNAQAQALGLRDTHATTPVGLDDPNMYSSAYDLAVLATIDYNRWPLFQKIVATQHTLLPASSMHPDFYLDNLNLLLSMYPHAVGIKTGFTGNAGGCLVAMAVRNGHHLISVLLNADYVYSQSRKLLDWGFTREGLPSDIPTPAPSPSPSARAH